MIPRAERSRFRARLRRHLRLLERINEAIATCDTDWSFAERLEAARALGLASWMPEPQEEMELTQGNEHGA